MKEDSEKEILIEIYKTFKEIKILTEDIEKDIITYEASSVEENKNCIKESFKKNVYKLYDLIPNFNQQILEIINNLKNIKEEENHNIIKELNIINNSFNLFLKNDNRNLSERIQDLKDKNNYKDCKIISNYIEIKLLKDNISLELNEKSFECYNKFTDLLKNKIKELKIKYLQNEFSDYYLMLSEWNSDKNNFYQMLNEEMIVIREMEKKKRIEQERLEEEEKKRQEEKKRRERELKRQEKERIRQEEELRQKKEEARRKLEELRKRQEEERRKKEEEEKKKKEEEEKEKKRKEASNHNFSIIITIYILITVILDLLVIKFSKSSSYLPLQNTFFIICFVIMFGLNLIGLIQLDYKRNKGSLYHIEALDIGWIIASLCFNVFMIPFSLFLYDFLLLLAGIIGVIIGGILFLLILWAFTK